ncbi:YopX family protein [Lacticaseibacillus paracasei]|uniref:YopX family protein n=1 Tax=Lacticaseibacillus paracasei TaxID=1597 RepID=UPI002FF60794
MKREIKFRSWVKRGNEIKDYVKPKTIQQMIHSKESTFSLEQLNDLVDFEQFTGLHDKNGREIYEGDIVSFGSVWNNGDDEDIDEEFHIGVVEYDPHYAVYNVNCEESGERRFLFTDVVNYDGFGVIGNIFENPELLEAKQ